MAGLSSRVLRLFLERKGWIDVVNTPHLLHKRENRVNHGGFDRGQGPQFLHRGQEGIDLKGRDLSRSCNMEVR